MDLCFLAERTRKGQKYTYETDELEKIIHLQRSDFSNSYYLRYGFNIKGLSYSGVKTHYFSGVGNSVTAMKHTVLELLDLENDLKDQIRIEELTTLVQTHVINEIVPVNTESDLIELIKQRSHERLLPGKVYQYLGL